MNFAIKTTNHVELEVAKENIQKFVKSWTKFIDHHEKAIEEINALADEPRRVVEQNMIKVVDQSMPDSDAQGIVKGLLYRDASPYKDYIEKSSQEWIRKNSNEAIAKYGERYQVELDANIRTQIKMGNLGAYFFTVKQFSLSTASTTPTSFDQQHQTQLQPQVKLHIDQSIKNVEEDKVGLDAHLQECIPPYVKKLEALTDGDVTTMYVAKTSEFEAEHHVKALNALSQIMSAYMR